jgi:RNA polymerase sigma-70 factor (ECF subfamily)
VTAVSTLSDEELLGALARQDLGALDALYDRHHRLALALARRILADEQGAEDVVQEVFLAVWRQAGRFRADRGSVKTWLLAMVHHRAIDRLRQRRPLGELAQLGEDMEDRREAPVWQQVHEHLQGEQIGAALAELPAEQRSAIELAYFGGKSQSEIAELQGVPLGTVKGRTRLGLEKLRSLLIGLREEPI